MATKTENMSNSNYMAVLLLVTVLVLGVAGISSKSLIGSIRHDSKVSKAKTSANKQLDLDLGNAPQLVNSYASLSDTQTRTLNHALPSTPDFPSFITQIETASALSGVTLASITPNVTSAIDQVAPATSAAATPMTLNSSIKVTGSYANLMKFYDRLEKSARPVRVTDMLMVGSGSSITASLSLTTYYQADAVLPFSTETIK